MTLKRDLVITQGSTFSLQVRWETVPSIFVPITGITQAAPAVVTAPSHGVPEGWRVAIVSVQGMSEINAQNTPPKSKDYVKATVSDADTLILPDVNAAEFSEYTEGGYVQYYTPVGLGGYTARLMIKTKVGGTELLSLTTENNRIDLDNTDKVIQLTIDADDTAEITWKKGVYDLEMVAPDETVTALMRGAVTVIQEVTT